jgi:hypothetical protein
MEIRKEIMELAEMMEIKMREKDDERGDSWKYMSLDFFKERINDELHELMDELNAPNPHVTKSLKEGADLANVTMMACYCVKRDWLKRIV